MKERPILFSGEMVRAILDGRKSQTRRVVKPQPEWIENSGRWCWPIPKRAQRPQCCTAVVTASREWWEYLPPGCCPYGQPRDRLWVRETWAVHFMYDDLSPSEIHSKYYADGATNIWYRADGDGQPGSYGCPASGRRGRWRPSIHMPRWASRITLEVTGVRVERIWDITKADCVAEGLELLQGGIKPQFAILWDSINDKRGFGWDVNPWVWVVEFRRVTP